MPQTLALQAQNPVFDLGQAALTGQKYRVGEQGLALGQQDLVRKGIDNRVAEMRAGEEQALVGALQNYRAKARKGDPSAVNELRGFPDAMKKVLDLHNSLNAGQQKKMEVAANRMALAADRIMRMPINSPERRRAWNSALEVFHKDGTITTDQYNAYWNNPSDLVLESAIALGRTVDQIITDREANKVGTRLTPEQTLDVEKAVNEFIDASTPEYGVDPGDRDKIYDQANELRQNLIRQMTGGGGGQGEGEGQSNTLDLRPTGGAPAAPALGPVETDLNSIFLNPEPLQNQTGRTSVPNGVYQPQTIDDFRDIPFGAQYVNPSDGRIMIKERNPEER